MEKQKHETALNARVRLKDQAESLYPRARTGSQGWVREQKSDSYGYPLVLIEWDRNHWTYSGEEDLWAFESHFEEIEAPKEEKVKKDSKEYKDMVASMKKFLADHENEPAEESRNNEQYLVEYAKALKAAFQEARESDSFILLTNTWEDYDGVRTLIPRFFSYYQSEEGGISLELQLAKQGVHAMEGLAIEKLREIMGDE